MFLIKEIWFNGGTTSTKVSGNYDFYEKIADKEGNISFEAWNCEISNWKMSINLSKLKDLKGLYVMNNQGQTIERII